MSDSAEPRTGEVPTANYGWLKPVVGGSADGWGAVINTDLDGIDSTVFAKLSDASTAGAFYGRKRGAWAQPDHTAITDWAATLAPYALTTALSSYLPLTGGALSGGLTVGGPADLKTQTVTQSGATLAINRTLGENCTLSLTASITGVTVTGWPASGITGKVRLIVANTGAFSIAGWPAGTIWPAGTAPTITPGAGKKDIILLMSDDGGATVFGAVVGQDFR
jgi:hypothetical protein